MKKIIFILNLLIVFFAFSSKILACKCVYEYTETGTSGAEKNYEDTMTIDENANKITFKGDFFDTADISLIDPHLDSKWNEKTIITDYLKGGCPDIIYACEGYQKHTKPDAQYTVNKFFPLINIGLEGKLKELDTAIKISSSGTGANGDEYLIDSSATCYPAELIADESTCKKVSLDLPCETYDNLAQDLKNNYCENCSIEQKNKYNQAKNKIKQFCYSKMANSQYFDPCLKSCLELNDLISSTEGKSSDEFNCGFSEKLIMLIANIIKWVKYIIPVIAIVLGILDFIKAIASDKDDEMKKAQGKFIKRLIAAALVFIIPFIIEFILTKMGFIVNGCGIIDL